MVTIKYVLNVLKYLQVAVSCFLGADQTYETQTNKKYFSDADFLDIMVYFAIFFKPFFAYISSEESQFLLFDTVLGFCSLRSLQSAI